jgi:tripartite ATP-independent transporter DctP family solute receptor
MDRRILQAIFALLTIVCAVGAWSAQTRQPDYVIKLAFLASVQDEDYLGAVAFKEFVEARGGGRIGVEIYPSGQFCGNERECIEGLQSGILEAHQTTIGGLAALFPEGQVFDLPYVFESDAVAECVFDGPMRVQVAEAIAARGLGLRLMAVGNTGGWRAFATTSKAVRSPEDLRRLKIRTLPSPLEQEMVRGLGAFPTPLPFSEVYTALGYGMLDGAKNSVQDMVGMKFQEHIKHVFLDRHAYMASLWWFSEARWQALPPDVQGIVAEGMKVLAAATRKAAADREGPALEAFRAAGGALYTPTPEERARFIEATSGVRGWYIEKFGPAWVDRLDEAVASCRVAEEAPSP